MMLDINLSPLREGFTRYLGLGAVIAVLIVVQLLLVFGSGRFGLEVVGAPVRRGADYSNTEELGVLLYTVYAYPFEIAAVVLLVAIIAAISLTMRRRPGIKAQNPAEQVAVRREDRVRLVKMRSEDGQ